MSLARATFSAVCHLPYLRVQCPVCTIEPSAAVPCGGWFYFLQWLKTTDANLTFIGDPIPGFNAPEDLTTRAAQSTKVTYCSSRINNICGGSCTVYNGGPACLDAPATVCLYAPHDVGFCDRSGYVFFHHAALRPRS